MIIYMHKDNMFKWTDVKKKPTKQIMCLNEQMWKTNNKTNNVCKNNFDKTKSELI